MFTKEEQTMWKRYGRFFEDTCGCGGRMLAVSHFLLILHAQPPYLGNRDVEFTCPRCGRKTTLHGGWAGAMLNRRIRSEYDRLSSRRGLALFLGKTGR